MNESTAIIALHVTAITMTVVAPAISVARGNGYIGKTTSHMLETQPSAAASLIRLSWIGVILLETPCILGFITGLLLLWRGVPLHLGGALIECAIAGALVIPAILVSWASVGPICGALLATARQPFHAARITQWMMVLVMLLQVSVLLGFILGLFLSMQLTDTTSLFAGLRFLIAGCTFGVGVIGPVIGLGTFATTSCTLIGQFPNSYGKLASFTFISQALIETPLFFLLGLTLLMMYREVALPILIAAGIGVILAVFGSGIASGKVADAAAKQIAQNPDKAHFFSGPALLAQTFIDTSVIYSLVIALALLTLSHS